MKIGVLGDVHGNSDALEAVLRAAASNEVETLLITGDLVGYYPFVHEVLTLLSGWTARIVRGNHEELLLGALSDSRVLEAATKKYGTGLMEAIDNLTKAEIDYLVQLPHPLKLNYAQRRIMLAHGSPEDINEYLYPDADFSKCQWLDSFDSDIFFCGHTHYPMTKVIRGKIIVNPGSVGQPRNKGRRAHWALYDTDCNTVQLKSESYDISRILEWAMTNNADLPYLHKVFTR